MFGLSKIELILLGAFAVMIATGGAIAWVYHEGGTAQAGKTATETLKETDDARKLREKNDAGARSLDDERALVCLRNPSGCQR